jgi:protein SCO1/2
MNGSNHKKGRLIKIVVLATILILPAFLYYLLEKEGINRYKALPIYGEKQLTGTFTRRMGKEIPDTLFHQIAPFKALNHQGESVEVLNDSLRIYVANFFYTRCATFCDVLLKEMDRVATRFANNDRVFFYSFTVDTLFDRPDVLAAYSQEVKPESKKWAFLTSPGNTLEVIRKGFLVDAMEDPSRPGLFIHSSQFVLLDSKKRIRGYYDVNKAKEVDRLIDEIKLLLIEEIRESSPY